MISKFGDLKKDFWRFKVKTLFIPSAASVSEFNLSLERMLIRKDTWEKVSERNSSIFLQSLTSAPHEHPLQSYRSPVLHKLSNCQTISCGQTYKAISFACCTPHVHYMLNLYSFDDLNLVVFLESKSGVNPECLFQSKMMNSTPC